MRAEGMLDDAKRLLAALAPGTRRGGAGHPDDAFAQAHELVIPIRLLALEGMRVDAAQVGEAGSQVGVEAVRRRHGRVARRLLSSSQSGPITNQLHGGVGQGLFNARGEGVAHADAFKAIKQRFGIEPVAQPVEQPASMAADIVAAVAEEDLFGHGASVPGLRAR